jgi:hypothetical protein
MNFIPDPFIGKKGCGSLLKIIPASSSPRLEVRKKFAPRQYFPKGKSLVQKNILLSYERLALKNNKGSLLAHSLPRKEQEISGGVLK